MTSYNQKKIIVENIMSLLEQSTSSDYKIIVSDDFSTDGSFEILNKLALNNNKLIVIRPKEKFGVGNNRNNLLRNATSDYICFVDGDDIQTNNFVDNILDAIKSKKKLYHFNKFNRITPSHQKVVSKGLYSYVWMYVFSRQIYEQVEFEKEVYYGEDYIFCMNYDQLLFKDFEVIDVNYSYHYLHDIGIYRNIDYKIRLNHELNLLEYKVNCFSKRQKIKYNEKLLTIYNLCMLCGDYCNNLDDIQFKYLRVNQKITYIFAKYSIFNKLYMHKIKDIY